MNDTWGHEIGDLAIKTEAKVLRAAFRDSDLIGRLSGDEFGVVAPGCPMRIVEAIRARLKDLNKEFSEEAYNILATYQPQPDTRLDGKLP